VKTVILCGGMGTRLREETEYRPKPMVEIGGRPILWHIMKLYAHHGFSDFVLCLGYKGRMIKEYFLNYQAMNHDITMCLANPSEVRYHGDYETEDFTVTLADTGQNTLTGGRLKRIARYVQDGTFLMTYGDGLADIDVAKVLAFHRQHGRLATLTSVRPVSRFGVLQTDTAGSVLEFAEKPNSEGWINAGFMVLEPGVLDYVTGDDVAFEQGPLERLAADGQLMAYRHGGFFFAMDTYREYLHLNQLWDERRAPWRVWDHAAS
jgi:glucose-1-phosphate cytidylyltransferase